MKVKLDGSSVISTFAIDFFSIVKDCVAKFVVVVLTAKLFEVVDFVILTVAVPALVLSLYSFGAGLIDKRVECPDREEGNPGAEAEALGGGNADPEAGIGARSLSDADGVQVPYGAVSEHFLDIRGGHRGVDARFGAFPGGDDAPVFGEGDGAQGGGGLDQEDACHGLIA